MPRRFQFSLLTILLFAICCALAIGWLATVERPKPPALIRQNVPTDVAIREWPITIAASEVGDFGQGYSWYLSVNSAGRAALTVDNGVESSVQQFRVSEEKLNMLRELLIFHPFFSLEEEQGEIVPDGSTQTLTITVGHISKTVQIHYLMNWVNNDREKLREPARALAVWMQIRGWFNHPNAADTRAYDQRVIDAVSTKKP
jgi:hypothetical protein